jgi:hypothetical protein
MREEPTSKPLIHSVYQLCMVTPTCFGITLPSSGRVPSAFWEMLNWGAVDRILWMRVLCLVTPFNPLTPELNPSAQPCLTRFFTRDFVSWAVHFVNICVKTQKMQQLFIKFINYVWYLLHVSVLHCQIQGACLVTSGRCSSEEQSIECCGWACGVYWRRAWRWLFTHIFTSRSALKG